MKDKIEKIIDRFRSSLDGEIYIYSMADYIFELEKRLQNTSDNSDYAKCNQCDFWEGSGYKSCKDCKRQKKEKSKWDIRISI